MIQIDYRLFLDDFEAFVRVIVANEDKIRKEQGLDALTEDEKTNLFLDLRKKHGISSYDKV
jgi:hypothetical protein